eukprot:11586-Chlamydomonas_euryale.AAC.1
MFLHLIWRSKQLGLGLLCLAIVTRHNLLLLLLLSLRTRLLRALRPGMAHAATFGACFWAALLAPEAQLPLPHAYEAGHVRHLYARLRSISSLARLFLQLLCGRLLAADQRPCKE